MAAVKVLVTGATGDTGRAAVDELLAKGYAVRALAHGKDERSKKLEDRGQIAFRYCTADGTVDAVGNPNGSIRNIAGVFNETKTVMGLMPHPENATEPLFGGSDGLGLFEGLVDALS